jgi:hypothetical protein
MQKQIAIWLAVFLLGATSFAATAPRKQIATPKEVTALQQERIKLMTERVAIIESFTKIDILDRAELARVRVDLAKAKLEYAKSNDQKRAVLDELIALHDILIKFAELKAKAPARAQSPGVRIAPVLASADALLLKSERIKYQIERETLK